MLSASVQLLVTVTEFEFGEESVRRSVEVTLMNEFPGMVTVNEPLPTSIDSSTAEGAATVRLTPPTERIVSVDPKVTSLYAAKLTAGTEISERQSVCAKRDLNVIFVNMISNRHGH